MGSLPTRLRDGQPTDLVRSIEQDELLSYDPWPWRCGLPARSAEKSMDRGTSSGSNKRTDPAAVGLQRRLTFDMRGAWRP
jgi:hypothetical protein